MAFELVSHSAGNYFFNIFNICLVWIGLFGCFVFFVFVFSVIALMFSLALKR